MHGIHGIKKEHEEIIKYFLKFFSRNFRNFAASLMADK
jgi:hypothetical protein